MGYGASGSLKLESVEGMGKVPAEVLRNSSQSTHGRGAEQSNADGTCPPRELNALHRGCRRGEIRSDATCRYRELRLGAGRHKTAAQPICATRRTRNLGDS